MKLITLTKDQYAKIDDKHYASVSRHSWWASKAPHHTSWKAAATMNGKNVYLHHFLFGEPPVGYTWDHIDRDGLNNQESNIRLATDSQNKCNRKAQSNNTSGKGVSFVRRNSEEKKYIAQIKFEGKYVYLGGFPTKEEAARAYNEAAKKYMGEFAYLNPV